MLPFRKNDRKPNKCLFTYTPPLPTYIDESQAPCRKKPFSTLLELQACHTITLLLPLTNLTLNANEHSPNNSQASPKYEAVEKHAQLLRTSLAKERYRLRFAKVNISLREILEGDFFNLYIKTGNITLISSGRPGIDNTYTVHEGILRLDLDKAMYERVGLQGHAVVSDGGQKHKRSRFVIEVNLRAPSMVSGKKGFERVKWAAREVLNETRTWLFYDHSDLGNGGSSSRGAHKASMPMDIDEPDRKQPIECFFPIWKDIAPHVTQLNNIKMLNFTKCADATAMSNNGGDEVEYLADLEEWLALAMLASPRLDAQTRIDPYLCRYAVPSFDGSPDEDATTTSLLRVQWRGLIPPQFLYRILIIARKHAASAGDWWAVSVASFHHGCVTLLRPPPLVEELQNDCRQEAATKEERPKDARVLEWAHPPPLPGL